MAQEGSLPMPSKVNLSLAICEYDHVRDLLSGAVQVEGADLNIQHFPIQDIFARFTRFREWDISEMSLAMYVSLLSQGDTSLTAIPVFPSRMFRQSAFFVRKQVKDHGTRSLIEGLAPGETLAGAPVVVVEDVTTTGGSALKAAEIVRAEGGDVVRVITIVDRLEGATDTFRAAGLEFAPLLTVDDFR